MNYEEKIIEYPPVHPGTDRTFIRFYFLSRLSRLLRFIIPAIIFRLWIDYRIDIIRRNTFTK